MGNTHMKQKVVISALAGMILIPGSAVPVKAAEEPEQGQPLLPAAGIEAVLEECYETEVKDNINLYLVPTEEGEYLNMAFSNTGDFTYIRSAPDENSAWVGKLYSDSAAEVLEYLDGWTKIRSGTAEGYVPSDTLITGETARTHAEEYENSTVRVTAYALNVRDGQGTEAAILTQVGQNEEYTVTGEPVDGWYPVKVGEIDGWVSGEYVEAETSYSYGETKEEEEARIAEEQEREEAVGLANGLLRGWSMNPVALSLRPLSGGIGSEEQGIDAQYNRLKQLTARAKAWDVDLGMALLTDDALEAKLALDREETPEQEWQTVETALDNLRAIGYRTNADWERNKHVTLGREFSPEAFSRTAFGAGVFAGENEVVHLETAQDFAGLPIVGRDDPGFDVERATWHEGSDGEEGRIGYYTLPKEDGDEQIAIPITSGRMVLTSRAELSRRVREGRFTDAVGAEANKDYRDLVAGRMGDGLTEGGKAWLRQYTPDGAGRFAFGGTSRGGVSNFLSVDGANAFRKLSQNDKELIEGIVQLRSPRNDVGSFWATAGEERRRMRDPDFLPPFSW